MAVVPNDPRSVLAGLRGRSAKLAEALYGIETEPEFALLRDPSQFSGASATVAAEARGRIDHLWQHYPSLTDGLDRLEKAIVDNNHAEIGRLRGPVATVLPDGSATSLQGLVGALEADLEHARSATRRLGDGWRTVVPQVDRLVAEVDRLTAVAADLGIGSDRDLATARRRVEQLRGRAAADPLGTDLAAVDETVRRARARIDGLAERRRALPQDLERARKRLADIDRLIIAGQEALAAARAKVTAAPGLLRPLDPAELDVDARSLRPWLTRLETMAAEGDWRSAIAGLDRWRPVADGWLANARQILEANEAPVRRRNELRGLLDGYRAKSAVAGIDVEPDVGQRYQSAHAALYGGPCDLDAATAKVDDYIDAVNRAVANA